MKRKMNISIKATKPNDLMTSSVGARKRISTSKITKARAKRYFLGFDWLPAPPPGSAPHSEVESLAADGLWGAINHEATKAPMTKRTPTVKNITKSTIVKNILAKIQRVE